MRRIVAAVMFVGTLTACGGSSSSRSMIGKLALVSHPTVGGVIDVTEDNFSGTQLTQPCEGTGGYSDIQVGASVTVRNAAGTIVGAGTLDSSLNAGGTCDFLFEVDHLPSSAFYTVEVSHRGQITVQASDLKSVSLSLGS